MGNCSSSVKMDPGILLDRLFRKEDRGVFGGMVVENIIPRVVLAWGMMEMRMGKGLGVRERCVRVVVRVVMGMGEG